MEANQLAKNLAWNRAKDQTNKHCLKWQPNLRLGLHTYLIFIVMFTCHSYSIIVLLNGFYDNPPTPSCHKITVDLILVFNWW